jgi:hypothetical protein
MAVGGDPDRAMRRNIIIVVALIVLGAVGTVLYLLHTSEIIGNLSPG